MRPLPNLPNNQCVSGLLIIKKRRAGANPLMGFEGRNLPQLGLGRSRWNRCYMVLARRAALALRAVSGPPVYPRGPRDLPAILGGSADALSRVPQRDELLLHETPHVEAEEPMVVVHAIGLRLAVCFLPQQTLCSTPPILPRNLHMSAMASR